MTIRSFPLFIPATGQDATSEKFKVSSNSEKEKVLRDKTWIKVAVFPRKQRGEFKEFNFMAMKHIVEWGSFPHELERKSLRMPRKRLHNTELIRHLHNYCTVQYCSMFYFT
jgi:hypothetical protein